MNRNNIKQKSYTMESDNEDVLPSIKPKQVIKTIIDRKKPIHNKSNQTIINDSDKVFLFVPFEYKDEARDYGAHWDSINKQYYTTVKDISNYQMLVDLYHLDNFSYSYYGAERSRNTTEKERNVEEEHRRIEHKRLYDIEKAEVILKKGVWLSSDEYNFGAWYSMHILNHP